MSFFVHIYISKICFGVLSTKKDNKVSPISVVKIARELNLYKAIQSSLQTSKMADSMNPLKNTIIISTFTFDPNFFIGWKWRRCSPSVTEEEGTGQLEDGCIHIILQLVTPIYRLLAKDLWMMSHRKREVPLTSKERIKINFLHSFY